MASAAASAAARADALHLYRRILRLHRAKLSREQRRLGDAYVKKEWRDHKTAAPSFVGEFLGAWRAYASDLDLAADHRAVGRDLPSKLVGEMSDDQRATLARLEREARGRRA